MAETETEKEIEKQNDDAIIEDDVIEKDTDKQIEEIEEQTEKENNDNVTG